MNKGHSIYGASGASRWRLCPGSVRVIQNAKAAGEIPPRKSDKYADEGTEAHDWSTKAITDEIPLGEMPDNFREHLEGYVRHCWEVEQSVQTKEHFIYNEEKVPLFYRPQDVGTVDHAVVCPAEFIHITDLKYGVGVKVDAEDNDQGMIYSHSFIEELEIMGGFDFAEDLPVFITIYQPRHHTFNGEPDTWEVTVGFLREQAKAIEADYKTAQNAGEKACTPSDKACQFCDAKGVCRTRAKTSFGGLPEALDIEADFDIEGEPKPDLPAKKPELEDLRETLTPEQIGWVCRNGKAIKKIVDNVIDAEIARLKAGGEVHEVKLVPGKLGNRTWEDEADAEKVVRSMFGAAEAYKPRKLLTAPQVLAKAKPQMGELSTIRKIQLGLADEATAAKSRTKCLIHRPEGKPLLVPKDDPTEGLIFTAPEDDFDVEE
jgi:hypothetical protein